MLTLRNAFKAASGDENNDAYLVQLTRLEKNAGLDHLRVTFYIQKNGVILAASWVVAIFDRLLPQRLTLLMGAEIIAKPTVYDVGAYDPTNGYLWIFYAIFGSLSVIPVATCFTVSVFILCIKRRKDEFVTNVPVDEGVQTDLPCRRLRFSRNEEEGKDYTCAPMPRLKRYSELSNIANFQLKGGELNKPSAKELSTIDEGSGSTNLTMLSKASTKHEKDTIEEGSVLRREIKTVKRSLPLLFPEEEVASSPDPQEGDAANGELLEPTPPRGGGSCAQSGGIHNSDSVQCLTYRGIKTRRDAIPTVWQ
nr:unnamed protein product [Spirometra erinaceieuropaei]